MNIPQAADASTTKSSARQTLSWSRRDVVSAAALLASLSLGGKLSFAEGVYPTRLIKIINPFAPGGNTDIVARLLANHLNAAWSQPVIVENKPGAGATMGTDTVAKSPPDGYTLLLATLAATAIAPAVYTKLPYNPRKDLVPISGLTIGYSAIGITPSLPVHTLAELIAYAKERPGQLMFSSPGTGVSSHLAMENFAYVTGTKLIHVPYRGSSPALMAVMTGEVQMTFDPISTMAPLIKDGKIRAIAVSGPARSPLLPDVPTTKEAGFPDIQSAAWTGLMAPAGTPAEVVEKIQREAQVLLSSDDFKARVAALASEVLDMPSDRFAKFLADETDSWGRIAKRVGAKLD
jgi:tripartite-type tricarboxylate transporter receptor subunit TctC